MNPVIETLVKELNRVMFGNPWYGSSIKNILDSVFYADAFKYANNYTHSIAELALHILAWNEETLSRFEGNEPKEPAIGDWPWVKFKDEMYWNEIKEKIYITHGKLIEIVKEFPLEKFEVVIGIENNRELATGYTYRESLLGLMQHNIYHAGQISLQNVALTKKNLS